MKLHYQLLVGIWLFSGFCLQSGAAVYKCKTPVGVTYSNTPCANDAEEVNIKSSRSVPKREVATGQPTSVDIQKFDRLPFDADEIIEYVGKPAAVYVHRGEEHWLYPNAVRVSPGERVCPEVWLRDGVRFQTSWLPENIMKKSVASAKNLKGWRPNGNVTVKRFYVSDTGIVGQSKTSVVSRLGQPDEKKVFMGTEVWEYYKVRYAPGENREVSIFLEFDGNKVSSSVGN